MHLSGQLRDCSRDCRRCAGERHCNCGSATTGGLRPPLLAVHAFVQRKSRFFTVERTPRTRSGGREPAVADGRCTCRGTIATVRKTVAGALPDAGAIAVAKPRGVYAPPLLAVHAFVQRKSRFFTVERTTCTRSGGREPAVADGRCTCRGDSANVRETADGVPADAGAVAVAKPRGVYAPRSWLCTRLCSAKVAFSPSSERRAPGAAGVTRRGGRAMHLSGHYRHCSEDCRRCLAGRRCSRGSETTGAYAPRS